MNHAGTVHAVSGDAIFDFLALKRALETSDADTIIGRYADDSEMTIVDRDHPPSAPLRIAGKPAIAAFWRNVCARDMIHRVRNEVVGPLRAAFIDACAYPDGCNVMSAMMLDLRDGRIVRHVTVQAWDDMS